MSTSVLAQATHVVTMPYHPQLTTKCQILFNGRTLQITGVASPEELGVETIAVCQEIVA
jgi:head-tail adaptor